MERAFDQKLNEEIELLLQFHVKGDQGGQDQKGRWKEQKRGLLWQRLLGKEFSYTKKNICNCKLYYYFLCTHLKTIF